MRQHLQGISAGIAAMLLATILFFGVTKAWGFMESQNREYQERRDRRRELIRECADKGGTPIITYDRGGRLTGYYGCTLPQGN